MATTTHHQDAGYLILGARHIFFFPVSHLVSLYSHLFTHQTSSDKKQHTKPFRPTWPCSLDSGSRLRVSLHHGPLDPALCLHIRGTNLRWWPMHSRAPTSLVTPLARARPLSVTVTRIPGTSTLLEWLKVESLMLQPSTPRTPTPTPAPTGARRRGRLKGLRCRPEGEMDLCLSPPFFIPPTIGGRA